MTAGPDPPKKKTGQNNGQQPDDLAESSSASCTAEHIQASTSRTSAGHNFTVVQIGNLVVNAVRLLVELLHWRG